MKKISVLFVCMGNICRSPMAEGAFAKALQLADLSAVVSTDSAGTHDYHVGDAPDLRAQRTALSHGFDISGLRGRQVQDSDFDRFDYVLAMDSQNFNALKHRAHARHHAKIKLLLSFSRRYPNLDVPDPYYGGQQGFDLTLAMVEDAAEGLLKHILAARTKVG
jgi:protein-tyrosine phosphatase